MTRMTDACGRREACDRRRLVSTVLAVEGWRLLRLGKCKERQPRNQDHNDRFLVT